MPSYNDLVSAYQQIDPGKVSDVGRILAALGGTGGNYSLSQLQGIGSPTRGTGGLQESGMTGLSSRSMSDWQKALGVLGSSPQPQASSFDLGSMTGAGGSSGGTGGSGLPTATVGPQQGLLNSWFTNASKGGGNIPGATTLFNLSQGKIPPAILQNFQNELARSNAGTTEMFGKVGNRFGTDLASTISRNSDQANVALQAQMADRALAAISQILGTGSQTAGFEFTGNQNALNRAFQEFMMQQQQYMNLLPLLLGGQG